jgi:farnesyl diphosphate synthase
MAILYMTAKDQQADPLADLLLPLAKRVEQDIERFLVEPSCPPELADAMRYCVLGGGKRLRPAMVHLSAAAVGGADDETTARAAVAIELVHCYSLVHDDLPAMDDDTLRRGRPTAHVRYGEAMAILAGDALLTRALGLLAEGPAARNLGLGDSAWPQAGTTDDRAASLVWELAAAAGQSGMIAGQAADMGLCKIVAGVEGLQYMHLRKTAALIRAAARMGAICGRASQEQLTALGEYGRLLGLAFQVMDDVLDVTAPVEKIGKTPGKDAAAGKKTYVSELGLDQASTMGAELTRAAIEALAPLGQQGGRLAKLAELLTGRSY